MPAIGVAGGRTGASPLRLSNAVSFTCFSDTTSRMTSLTRAPSVPTRGQSQRQRAALRCCSEQPRG
eukprot:1347694-Rhodomonas_salina.1